MKPMTEEMLRKNPLNKTLQRGTSCRIAEFRKALVLTDILDAGYSPVNIAEKANKETMQYQGPIGEIKGTDLMGTTELPSQDYYFIHRRTI